MQHSMVNQRQRGAAQGTTRRRRVRAVERGVRAEREQDPRSLLRALSREVSRVQVLEAQLSAAKQTIDALRSGQKQQLKRSAEIQASLTTLVESLQAIMSIGHGKRVDRRLARAQKTAERGLKRAQVEQVLESR